MHEHDSGLLYDWAPFGQEKRTKFLKEEWLPYIKRLRKEMMEIQARSVAGVLQERMTPQKDLVELAEKCLELTEVVNASMN